MGLRHLAPILILAIAGCATPSPAPEGEGTPRLSLPAPWWELGESWTMEIEQPGRPTRTTTLVNFANDTFGDPAHFWLGVRDRNEALSHVFFDDDPFLGRIHWELLAPHEKGMHAAMYDWPLEDGRSWTSPLLLGKEDLVVTARARPDGTFAITGEARADGASFEYDHDPATRWFRHLTIREADGSLRLRADVIAHGTGEQGTFWFLRGRDYLDSKGGRTGEEQTFTVKEEGATSIAFLLDVRAAGPLAAIEFVDPSGAVFHRETLPLGATSDKIVEVTKAPPPGSWKLRFVGEVTGEIRVRGIVEYSARL